MKSRLVSVTGATGFLGAHIVGAFVRAGWQVRAIVRPGRAGAAERSVDYREAPLERGALVPAIEDSDVVVHVAGLTRGGAAALTRTNVDGTRAVVGAINECGARLVHLSSQAAIGAGTPARPAREDDPPRPVNAYGLSKLEGEAVVSQLARVPWVVLRPSAVYGPNDRQWLPLVRLAARGMFPLVTRADLALTLVYVDDVARATVLAAERDDVCGQAFFVGHHEPETAGGVLAAIAQQVKRPYHPRRVPVAVVRSAARLGDLSATLGFRPLLDSARLAELLSEGFVCAVDRAQEELGFTAEVSLSEGLARTIRWYRDTGWL